MWSYFKFELKQLITNKKNLAIYVLLFCISCFYAISIAPDYDPIEKVDIDAIKASYETKEAFLNNDEFNEYTHFDTLYAYEIYTEWNKLDGERIKAYEAGDYKTFADATSKWYLYADSVISSNKDLYYNDRYYDYDNTFGEEDGHYAYLYTASRYADYAKGDSKLSFDVFEERTALQTLQRLLESYLPYVLLVGCILLAVDIVLKDRKNQTIIKGFPISTWRRLLVKGVVSFIGSLFMFVPLAVGLIIIGIRSGFGDFQLAVPIYSLAEKNFNNITMGDYLLQNIALICCWFLILIAMNLLVSVVIKVEFANIIAGIALILWEGFYFFRGMGYFKDIQLYPPSYVKVGQVISGHRNYLYTSEKILLENGVIVLVSSAIVLLLLTYFISSFKKYKFV